MINSKISNHAHGNVAGCGSDSSSLPVFLIGLLGTLVPVFFWLSLWEFGMVVVDVDDTL